MTQEEEKHWHSEYIFPVFVLWTRHDTDGSVIVEILTVAGVIPIGVKIKF